MRRFITAIVALAALTGMAWSAEPEVKLFDGSAKKIVVNGYSTSFKWPDVLQRKLDRYTGGRRVIQVQKAVKGGTPIARWIDAETGQPLPAWQQIVQPALQDDRPVIVLGQQSLQWVYGPRAEGIRGPEDRERIARGADVLERYVRRLQQDGADLVLVAMHIYKHPMEPAIGHERLALEELVRRKLSGFHPGPDVWTATKELYPRAFAADRVHPNSLGAELMAQHWFEALLKREDLDIPAWSRQELQDALQRDPGVQVDVPPTEPARR
jgi:hypothetical protein